MKCKILFETKNVPTFEDFEKSIHQCEGCSIRMIIETACQIIPYSFIKGYLLTPADQCYRFEYYKETSRILTETIGELKPKVSLTFDTLRKANIQRLSEFKNSKGLPAHSKSDGSDWSPSDWLGAVLGELGEYANVMKKVKRGDLTFEEAKPLIEKELADVMTYLDILAFRVGVDLSKAVEQKFNEVSERVGCSLRIENNEVVRKEVKTYAEATSSQIYPREWVEFRQIYHQKWVEHYKQYAYPLEVRGIKINRSQIIDLFGLEFQELNTLKSHIFFQVKELYNSFCKSIFQSYLFDFFSKQLNTKIVGMLINGHKENKILNLNDTVQFYDDRNVLYNFRLVKSSDKNVEVSAT